MGKVKSKITSQMSQVKVYAGDADLPAANAQYKNLIWETISGRACLTFIRLLLQFMFQNTGYSDPGIYLHCPNLKTQLYGHVGEKKTENVRSWQACSRLCGQRTGCRYWTWHHTGQYHKANTCLTMTNVSSKGGNNNAVSGSKSCF